MGNSFPKEKCMDVGTNASIKLGRADFEEGKQYSVSHYIGGKSFAPLCLWITYRENGVIKDLDFIFYEAGSVFTFIINKEENNLLNHYHKFPIKQLYEINFNKTKNHPGGVTKTDVAYHRVENGGNPLVVEQKSEKGVEKPFAIRVAHYYAFSKQCRITRRKSEVGLSIVVDIRVLNNDLVVSMMDPFEHPSLVLLQMFQQVSTTWTWKWTSCSHCADQTHMQQFETDTENDDEEETNYLQWSRQIGRNNPVNQGVIQGNYNGNLVLNFPRGGN